MDYVIKVEQAFRSFKKDYPNKAAFRRNRISFGKHVASKMSSIKNDEDAVIKVEKDDEILGSKEENDFGLEKSAIEGFEVTNVQEDINVYERANIKKKQLKEITKDSVCQHEEKVSIRCYCVARKKKKRRK